MSIFIATLLLAHSDVNGLRILPAPSSLMERDASQKRATCEPGNGNCCNFQQDAMCFPTGHGPPDTGSTAPCHDADSDGSWRPHAMYYDTGSGREGDYSGRSGSDVDTLEKCARWCTDNNRPEHAACIGDHCFGTNMMLGYLAACCVFLKPAPGVAGDPQCQMYTRAHFNYQTETCNPDGATLGYELQAGVCTYPDGYVPYNTTAGYRPGTPFPDAPAICTHKTDIVFVIDRSGSMGHNPTYWPAVTTFAKDAIGNLTLGPEAARVAIVTFNGAADLHEGFSYDVAHLQDRIDDITISGGTSYLAGINEAKSLFDANPREGLESRLVIIVGDGAVNQPDAVRLVRGQIEGDGQSSVFAVGIGDSAITGLGGIVSASSHFFAVASFGTLLDSAGDILTSACESVAGFAADDSGVGGDPHVTNLAGNKFDIQKAGTYSLLTINEGHAQQLALALHASIDQVADACSAKYIQNASLSGRWLDELENSRLDVRVAHWIPKEEALQVLIGKEWHPVLVAKDRMHSDILTKTTSSQVNVLLHGVAIRLSVGMNIRKVDKNQGYNFMNVNLKGLSTLDSSVRLGGLLTLDDFSGVAEAPTECHARRAKLLTRMPSENDGQLPFLSTIDAGPEDISFFRSTRNQH